ncbi:MAG TPA: hypothetical protein VIH97_11300 [Candidatus Acidoferrales bacterium]
MMYKFIGMGALLLAASLVPATLPAQSQDDKPATTSSATNPATTSVTGCVAAGKKAGTYKLTADDGTVYMLRSKSTNLGEHVGHTVTVSGRVMSGANGSATPSNSANSSDATGADQNSAGANGAAAGGAMKNHLMVHKLTMVSESCKTAQ